MSSDHQSIISKGEKRALAAVVALDHWHLVDHGKELMGMKYTHRKVLVQCEWRWPIPASCFPVCKTKLWVASNGPETIHHIKSIKYIIKVGELTPIYTRGCWRQKAHFHWYPKTWLCFLWQTPGFNFVLPCLFNFFFKFMMTIHICLYSKWEASEGEVEIRRQTGYQGKAGAEPPLWPQSTDSTDTSSIWLYSTSLAWLKGWTDCGTL